jgi:hypothetical protein
MRSNPALINGEVSLRNPDIWINENGIEYAKKLGEKWLKEFFKSEEQKKEELMYSLQIKTLEKGLLDLDNKLKNFKPSNQRANWAIIISILSLLAAIVLGVLSLKHR